MLHVQDGECGNLKKSCVIRRDTNLLQKLPRASLIRPDQFILL